MYKDISADEFQEGVEKDPDAVLLDVRTPMEYSEGHIPGAELLNIMAPDFVNKLQHLDKDKNYYVYCRSGSRSAGACQYMDRQGFKNAFNLQQGIISWKGEIE